MSVKKMQKDTFLARQAQQKNSSLHDPHQRLAFRSTKDNKKPKNNQVVKKYPELVKTMSFSIYILRNAQ